MIRTRLEFAALAAALVFGISCATTPKETGAEPPDPTTTDESPPATAPEAAEPKWPTPSAEAAPAENLIPREVLFGNPDRSGLKISPDGRHLSWLAPDEGVMNVWVAPVSDLQKARAVTRDRKRSIRTHFWAFDNKHVLYPQDEGGDENWHIHAVDVTTGEDRDLTPLPKVQARVVNVSHKVPGAILIGLNDRDPRLHDLHKVDLKTGKRELVMQNDGWLSFLIDEEYDVRFASRMTPAGGMEIFELDPKTRQPRKEPFASIAQADVLTTSPLGFDVTGNTLYMFDSRGRDTAALTATDLKAGKTQVLAAHERVDVDDWMVDPKTLRPQAAGFDYLKPEWKVLDPKIAKDLEYLRTVSEGELKVLSRSLDDRQWAVAYVLDDGPVRYYRYDRPAKKATFLFTNRKALEDLPLAKMHPVAIPARDKLELVSYLTLPRAVDEDGDGKPSRPVPLVLTVHGGPWGRDAWGLDPLHQWLANRGYAALSTNFRGSTGFGKAFVNAGDKQWATRMHDDLLDAVDWAVKNGITTADSVAITGGSYGGYATLVGLTFTPDRFACGVDIVGPSNLRTLLETIPPYWQPMLEMFASRVGDPRTEEGRKLLEERSPLGRIDAISRPLLIGQGANDPRVKQAESDQIVKAMQEKNIPVTYVLFPDEGHGFARPENRLAFNAVMEAFLGKCLGGGVEPVGDDFQNSSIQVPEGARHLPDLPESVQGEQ